MTGSYTNSQAIRIISPETKAISWCESAYFQSVLLEKGRTVKSTYSPLKIIDFTCIINGSTLKGRNEAVKRILNAATKLPIPISPQRGIYMFPTAAAKSQQCIWLAFEHIKGYEERNGMTYIEFNDGTGLFTEASLNTIDSQYKRTSHLIVQLNRKILFGRERNNR